MSNLFFGIENDSNTLGVIRPAQFIGFPIVLCCSINTIDSKFFDNSDAIYPPMGPAPTIPIS